MILTPTKLVRMCGGNPSASNVESFCTGLNKFGSEAGLDKPHRLAQYIGQMMHESARFRHDREIWGPTPAQKRYDTRTDLGNSPEADGDGKKYSGKTAIQITGKSNYRQFTRWARVLDPLAPDFVVDPDAANTDPWEGLGPIWYWDTRNLNVWADKGDRRAVTKKINGGYNGMSDRNTCIDRASLVLLGYAPDDIRGFQSENGLDVDGESGKNTRTRMHKLLSAATPAKNLPVTTQLGAGVAVSGAAIAGAALFFDKLKILFTEFFDAIMRGLTG